MSLHDVSKHDDTRLDPKANASDTRAQREAHGTVSQNFHTDASSAGSGILMGMLRPVATGTLTVQTDGSTLNTATKAHGLGYKPFMLTAIENATATVASGTATGVSFFLPTYLQATLSVSGDIQFGLWLEAFCNDTNIYVQMLNTLGIVGSSTVTYYLFQQSPA